MKPINEYRNTNTFVMGPRVVAELAAIARYYGNALVAVGHDAKLHCDTSCYTVRISGTAIGGVFDCLVTVDVLDKVAEREREIVCEFTSPVFSKLALGCGQTN